MNITTQSKIPLMLSDKCSLPVQFLQRHGLIEGTILKRWLLIRVCSKEHLCGSFPLQMPGPLVHSHSLQIAFVRAAMGSNFHDEIPIFLSIWKSQIPILTGCLNFYDTGPQPDSNSQTYCHRIFAPPTLNPLGNFAPHL